MNSNVKPTRIDFERIDINKIDTLLKTGDVSCLPPAEREYYLLMELVRGYRARMLHPNGEKVVTKAGIIRILKNTYGLSDWMARQVYSDTLNFFYSEEEVSPKAWRNLYAEKLEKMADLAFAQGKFKEGRTLLNDAAKHRGCFDEQTAEIPEELLAPNSTIVYTADALALGAPRTNRKELEAFVDSLPDIPAVAANRVKEDAGLKPKDLMRRMAEDIKEFGDEE